MKHGMKVLQNDIHRGARALIALGSIFALILFASACKNYHLDDADASRAGTGSVSVSLSDSAGSRMVMPSAPSASTIARYDIACSRAGYDNKGVTGLTDTASLTVNDLAEGEWVLTVDAYDSLGAKVATGLTNVTIVAGKTAAASVVLSPIFPRTAGGKGTVSLVFACSGFQAQSNSWEIELAPAAGGSPVTYTYETSSVVTCDQVANTITISATLDSGDWDMAFRLRTDGATFVSTSDVVKVYDGLTSVSATGGAIPISASDFFKADRVRYVSNTAETGHAGNTRAQACTLKEAIIEFNTRFDLTEADPGVIILTENVVHTPQDGSDIFYVRKPMKIMSLASAASPYAIEVDSPANTLIKVDSTLSSDAVSLTLERVTVQAVGSGGAEFGLVQVQSGSAVAKLILNAGATVKGNTSGIDAGGVYLQGGTLVMNAGSEISGNTAKYGGGVCSTNANDEIELNGGLIRANRATVAAGGVSLSPGATLTVASGTWEDTVKDNQADAALPDLARGYTNVYQETTIIAALSAPEPAYIDLLASVTMTVSSAFTVAKPVAIIGESPVSTLHRTDKNNPLLTISSGGLLTLSGYLAIDGQNDDGSQSLVSVEQNGTFIMAGADVSLQNTKVWGVKGSAISVAGTFLLKDGKIQSSTNGNSDGSVYVASTGTMRMDSGIISGGKANNGAGVCVGSSGKFYLYGGKISGNVATTYGGGIYIEAGGALYLRNFNHSLDGNLTGNAPSMDYGDLAVASAGAVYFSDVETPSPSSWVSINAGNATGYTGFTNCISSGRYHFF